MKKTQTHIVSRRRQGKVELISLADGSTSHVETLSNPTEDYWPHIEPLAEPFASRSKSFVEDLHTLRSQMLVDNRKAKRKAKSNVSRLSKPRARKPSLDEQLLKRRLASLPEAQRKMLEKSLGFTGDSA